MASTSVESRNNQSPHLMITRPIRVKSQPGLILYEGWLLGLENGKAVEARPDIPCLGVAILTRGAGWETLAGYNHVKEFLYNGAAETDIGSVVYALDNKFITTTPNSAPLGKIIAVDTNKVYVHLTLDDGGVNTVDSVFGRTGDVVAETDDYAASQVNNDSGVTGAQVSDALDNLDSAIDYWDNIFIDACTAPQALAGTWVAQPTTTQAGGQLINTSNAVNDTAQWQFSAHAGTYAVAVRGNVGPDRGIIQFLIDGVQIFGPPGGVDLYSPVAIWNVSATALNVNIATTGTHLFTITCTGKNASSTGFYIPLTNVRIWRLV